MKPNNLLFTIKQIQTVLKGKLQNSGKDAIDIGSRLTTHLYDRLGLSKLEQFHKDVIEAENNYINLVEQRSEITKKSLEIQKQLAEVRDRLNKTKREDDTYLQLLQEDYQLYKKEQLVSSELKAVMDQEMILFNIFSQKLRDSHQMEIHHNLKQRTFSLTISLIYGAITCFVTLVSLSCKYWFENEITTRLSQVEVNTQHLLQLENENQIKADNLKQELIKMHADCAQTDFNISTEPNQEIKPISALNSQIIQVGLLSIMTLSMIAVSKFV